MNTLIIQFKKITPLCFAVLALGCLALLPETQAVEPAAPDIVLANGNTAEGHLALAGLTTGIDNSAFGFNSLRNNGAANYNTGVGSGALFSNTTGSNNAADGTFAMAANTTGADNTALGFRAL
jgi:hypothetical protein